jgi:hypothetical protein
LFVALLAVGGKPYYLAGMYPVLLDAGAEPTLRWIARAAESRPVRRLRAGALAIALVFSAAATAVLTLPVVPARMLPGRPIAAVQPISGDTIGRPEYMSTIASVYHSLPPGQRTHTVALTWNYGEAGAIDLFRRHMDLPPPYSGHNSYADWGPPPESATTVIAVGFDEPTLRRWFASVQQVARLDNRIGLATLEQGRPVFICTDRRDSWAQLWPELRHIA